MKLFVFVGWIEMSICCSEKCIGTTSEVRSLLRGLILGKFVILFIMNKLHIILERNVLVIIKPEVESLKWFIDDMRDCYKMEYESVDEEYRWLLLIKCSLLNNWLEMKSVEWIYQKILFYSVKRREFIPSEECVLRASEIDKTGKMTRIWMRKERWILI